jgi:hypothetical protein
MACAERFEGHSIRRCGRVSAISSFAGDPGIVVDRPTVKY